MPGLLTFFGSGETAAGMVRVHRRLFEALPQPHRPVFVNTPAGFELGLEAINDRFQNFFQRSLGLSLQIATFRRADEEAPVAAAALTAVAQANYLLAGPGSPTYAIRHWRGTPIYAAMLQRWQEGAQLALASSAAIALSRYALPVYEIYKVGLDLHWSDGLNLLGPFGLELAIVPHWDNAEGSTHDTGACFMGMSRFLELRAMLPPSAVVLGIDEHTACILDLDSGEVRVDGRGDVTVLRGLDTLRFASGESFQLSELKSPDTASHAAPGQASRVHPSHGLALASDLIAKGNLTDGLRQAARLADTSLASVLVQAAQTAETIQRQPAEDRSWEPLVELLVDLRGALRTAQMWDLADAVRNGLLQLGITLQDTPQGPVWTRGKPR